MINRTPTSIKIESGLECAAWLGRGWFGAYEIAVVGFRSVLPPLYHRFLL